MGFGDQIMAGGRASQLHKERGGKYVIGTGKQILWSPAYENNPYIGRETPAGAEWIIDYAGCRPYLDYEATARLKSEYLDTTRKRPKVRTARWVFKRNQWPTPLEMFYTPTERETIKRRAQLYDNLVIIEPNIKTRAPPTKQWNFLRYQRVVDQLKKHVTFLQFRTDNDQPKLEGVHQLQTEQRDLFLWMKAAKAYLGGEGGLHHVAAATATQGVVIFGGYVPPDVTGYKMHTNLYTGDEFPDALGWRIENEVGRAAMNAIQVNTVVDALAELL